MSFFGSTYSNTPHHLHEADVRHLVSSNRVASVDYHDEQYVETAILAHRDSEHRISMQKIHDVLTSLRNEGKISEDDKKGLMVVFKDFFAHI